MLLVQPHDSGEFVLQFDPAHRASSLCFIKINSLERLAGLRGQEGIERETEAADKSRNLHRWPPVINGIR